MPPVRAAAAQREARHPVSVPGAVRVDAVAADLGGVVGHQPHRPAGQQLPVEQRAPERVEVLRGGHQAARGAEQVARQLRQVRPSRLRIGRADPVVVGVRPPQAQLAALGPVGVVQAERAQDRVLDVGAEVLARHPLDDHAEHEVIGVRVAPVRPRLERGLLRQGQGQVVLVGRLLVGPVHPGDVLRQAAGLRQQLPHRDVAAGQLRHVTAGGVVQPQPVFGHQPHHRHRGERLGVARDPDPPLGPHHRPPAAGLGRSRGERPLPRVRQGPRHAVLRHQPVELLLHRVGASGRLPAPGRGDGGGPCHQGGGEENGGGAAAADHDGPPEGRSIKCLQLSARRPAGHGRQRPDRGVPVPTSAGCG